MSASTLSFELKDMPDFDHQAAEMQQLRPGVPLLELTPARYKSLFHRPEPKILITRRDGQVVDVGSIILRTEKTGITLVATISGKLSEAGFFRGAIIDIARQVHATKVILEIFGNRDFMMPPVIGETSRHATAIYVCDLTRDDLAAALSSNHRRNLRKAEAAGFTIAEGKTAADIEAHVRLCGASNDRRAGRGEKIQGNKDRRATEGYLASGYATLMQCRQGDETMSSILVLRIGDAAYYDTGGTSPEGMRMGGSHFLMFRTMERLKSQGVRTFSLDVANSEGLVKFKTGFGAEEWPLQRIYIEYPTLVSRLKKRIRALIG